MLKHHGRGFDMDYAVQLSFDNVNAPEIGGYGVDHTKVAEGLGCKAPRVYEPAEMVAAFETAQKLMAEHRLPVVVEIMLERITNISMGPSSTTSPSSRSWPNIASTRRPRWPCSTDLSRTVRRSGQVADRPLGRRLHVVHRQAMPRFDGPRQVHPQPPGLLLRQGGDDHPGVPGVLPQLVVDRVHR